MQEVRNLFLCAFCKKLPAPNTAVRFMLKEKSENSELRQTCAHISCRGCEAGRAPKKCPACTHAYTTVFSDLLVEAMLWRVSDGTDRATDPEEAIRQVDEEIKSLQKVVTSKNIPVSDTYFDEVFSMLLSSPRASTKRCGCGLVAIMRLDREKNETVYMCPSLDPQKTCSSGNL